MQVKLEINNKLNDFATSNIVTANRNKTNTTDQKVNIQESQSVESSKTSQSKPATIPGLNPSTEKIRDEDIRESPVQQNKESKKSCTINIYGFQLTEDDLKEFFSKCGDVTNIKFGSRNAQLQFANREGVEAALKYNESLLFDKRLYIQWPDK